MKRFLFCLLFLCVDICGSEVTLLFGSPGSGKGTFSQWMKGDRMGHISAGDVIREEVMSGSLLGQSLAQIVERGECVDSNVLFQLVQGRVLSFVDRGMDVILDGYGRTPHDWEMLLAFLGDHSLKVQVVVLEAPPSLCKERMMNRLVCLGCGLISSCAFGFDVGSSCPGCQTSKLTCRMNDVESVIDKRIRQYHEEIFPQLRKTFGGYDWRVYQTDKDLESCLLQYEGLRE